MRDHYAVVRDTLHLYKLSLMDRSEAIRLLKIDAEVRRQMEETERRRRAHEAGENLSEEDKKLLLEAETDFAELTVRVAKMFPKELAEVKSVEDAVRLAADKREEMHALAANRLETVGSAISEFMVGYREGKAASLKDVVESKDPFFDHLIDPMVSSEKKPADVDSSPPSPPSPPSPHL
jgi:predicted ATP-grasp superfamily ATP-dependent carboligase